MLFIQKFILGSSDKLVIARYICAIWRVLYSLQKILFTGVLLNSCSDKYCRFSKKTIC